MHQLGEVRRTTFSATAKKMLNNSGDNTHPCRSPRSTSNHYRASLSYYNSIVGGDKSPHCPMKTPHSVPSSPVKISELSFPFLRKSSSATIPVPFHTKNRLLSLFYDDRGSAVDNIPFFRASNGTGFYEETGRGQDSCPVLSR